VKYKWICSLWPGVCVALMDVCAWVMSHEEISAGAVSARSVLELYAMLTG